MLSRNSLDLPDVAHTAGPPICGPYTAAIFYHAATANVPGTVKTVPYKAPVNPICREGFTGASVPRNGLDVNPISGGVHRPFLPGRLYAAPTPQQYFYHAATANVPGTVKTVPYKAPVNPICREGFTGAL